MELNIEIEQECPICFINIEHNDAYLLLSCCNKKVHISCLDNWYNKTGKKNKLCFLCTKESNDLESIIVRSPIIEHNNRTINSDFNYDFNYKFFFFLWFYYNIIWDIGFYFYKK